MRPGVRLAGLLLLLGAGQSVADPAADANYQAGLAAYTAGDYQTAIQQAEAAAAADPRHWQAWQLDGNARYALGDKAGALTVYKYSLQINPDNPQLKAFADSLEPAPAPAPPAPAATPVAAAEPQPLPAAGPAKSVMSRLSLGGWVGLATGGPGEVNRGRQAFVAQAKAEAASYGDTIIMGDADDMKNSITGGLEFGYDILDRLTLGLRLGSLSVGTSHLSFRDGDSFVFSPGNEISFTMDYVNKMSASASCVTVGGRYRYPLTPKLTVGLGLFAGLGLASADEDASITYKNVGTGIFASFTDTKVFPWKQGWGGRGPAAEAMVNATYALHPHLWLGLEAGYRYFTVSNMKALGLVRLTEDTDGDGVQDYTIYESNIGDPYRNLRYDLSGNGNEFQPTGSPVPFDFGGLLATVAATCHF